MEEIWKDIEGYEGLYQVSNLGRVKNKKRNKILSLSKYRTGYSKCGLYKNHTPKTYAVHRLVAQAFIPNPKHYPVVNHEDETRDNNRVDNLEWCTIKYNVNFGNAQKRKAENRDYYHSKYAVAQVKKMSHDNKIPIYGFKGDKKIWFSSSKVAAQYTKATPSTVSDVLRGRYKTSRGWRFKYEKDVEI